MLKSHVRAVVIGGGVVGVSVLYHLAKLGWTDVLLVERAELTSGSTWHAAGGFHTLNADTNMAALQGYTIGLYRELEELTGLSCGLHHVGGVTLADTPERMDYLRAEHAKHRYMGLDTKILTPGEIKALTPITNVDGLIGGLHDPLDGHLDPSGTTHAYAKAAKMAGAQIVLRNPVLETRPQPDGGWEVVTRDGTIIAEHLVNAAGLWAREVGAMAGVYLPLHAMEHQYLITEDLEEVFERDTELPHAMDPGGESYLRQEGRGLCIGFYERDCTWWATGGTPPDFGTELLNQNLDRIGPSLEAAFHRYPVLERAGIKTVVNGPFTFAPDGNPLVGPVPGLANYWSACAVMAGFSQGGGVGLTLAEWMTQGEPDRDAHAMDVARFGDWITPGYTRAKVKENYQRRFSISFPNEELPAARPHRTTPAYAEWKARRAVFGDAGGMEVVNYFARTHEPLEENPTFRRSNAFAAVAAECRAVRETAGINEIHNFGKYRISGSGARAWLNRIMAGRIPPAGQLGLTPMLSPKGRLIGDLTVSALAEDEFQLIGSFAMAAVHMRWFAHNLAPDGSVEIEDISTRRLGFQIAGPHARDILQEVAFADVSNKAFKFLDVKTIDIGTCRALVQRVSYTGDLGYEIYVDAQNQLPLFQALWEAGEPRGLTPFGMRAMMSLRLEKSFGSWGREYRPDYTAAETGLDRFIAFGKSADFIGRAPAEAERSRGADRHLSTFTVNTAGADVWGDEPIFYNGEVVGFVTSGGFAHHAMQSVAFGILPAELIRDGLEVEIEILGERRPATLYKTPLFDPDGSRMRGDGAET
ncbi:Sarcosine dehydrogenase [hydrothermal vent metagenome]|uniref:Sarcosine dehydrogenase n=1 Tax=hydrothermal vent metagenome TaxID=652676 RepID=A0A3B0U6H9_9ZZZZ